MTNYDSNFRQPEHNTTIVNAEPVRRGGGAGWFVAGALVIAAVVAVFMFAGDALDTGTTASIDVPDEVNVNVPDVDVPDVNVDVVEPAAPANQ